MLIFIELITIHLGKNPMKGGIPPKDKKFSIKKVLINGVEFKIITNWLIKKILNFKKIKTILIVISE